MTVKFIDSINSTQDFLIKSVKDGSVTPPFMIVARMQTQGVGSRGNEWQGLVGNLFMSFCIDKEFLPNDIPSNSLSIYFTMIMREILRVAGSNVWVKWPNDFYVDETKIGGTITSKLGDVYICGIGLNLIQAPENAGILDINLSITDIVDKYVKCLYEKMSWKEIFSKFAFDFEKSKAFFTHRFDKKISLNDAILLEDGSLFVNNERIFSMR
ncbi:MAG: biotin--[acetyl-CoA-carboxylase] ligase [Campylobacter sp.]